MDYGGNVRFYRVAGNETLSKDELLYALKCDELDWKKRIKTTGLMFAIIVNKTICSNALFIDDVYSLHLELHSA